MAALGQSLRVLVVDDNPDDLVLIRRLLARSTRHHFVVEGVRDFDAALEAFSQTPYHVGLIDYHLGPHDGLELLRAAHAQQQTLSFILLTGHEAPDVDLEALRAGAADYLVKSELTPTLLERTILYSLERSRATAERRAALMQLMLSDRLASVGTMAMGIAHEVNNPLTLVLGNLDYVTEHFEALLKGTGDVDELRSAIADAREGAHRVRKLVKEFKDLGGDCAALQPLELQPSLELALTLHAGTIGSKARIETRFEPAPLVRANSARLNQIWNNLLTNATQAIPDENPQRHRIVVRTSTDEEGRAQVEIEDSGVGIPPENLSRIFDPFFTTRQVGEGLGFGLAICYRAVQEMGGRIAVESHPGRGSLFRVILPAAELA